MKKITTYLSISFISFLLLLMSSCYIPKIVSNDGAKWIPKNFNPKKDLLVIEYTPYKNQTKKMQKYMEEKYPYKYEFITTAELNDSASISKDKKVYRFILHNSNKTISYASDLNHKYGGSHKVYAASNDFYFADRDANRIYPETQMASGYPYHSFKSVINVILKKFE